MNKTSRFFLVLACAAGFSSAQGEVKLADPFADGVVLQRGRSVPVWGTAESGRKVRVEFADASVTAEVGADGKWRVDLPALDACREGRELKATEFEPGFLFDSETSSAMVSDVLVGDVWFVSGQSNTEFPLCDGEAARQGPRASRRRFGS